MFLWSFKKIWLQEVPHNHINANIITDHRKVINRKRIIKSFEHWTNEVIDNRWTNVDEIRLERFLVSSDINKVYKRLLSSNWTNAAWPPNTLNFILEFLLWTGFCPGNLQLMYPIYCSWKAAPVERKWFANSRSLSAIGVIPEPDIYRRVGQRWQDFRRGLGSTIGKQKVGRGFSWLDVQVEFPIGDRCFQCRPFNSLRRNILFSVCLEKPSHYDQKLIKELITKFLVA